MAEGTTNNNNKPITKDWMDEYDRGVKAALAQLKKADVTIPLNALPEDWTALLSYSAGEGGSTVSYDFKPGDRVIVEDRENGEEDSDYLVVYTLLKRYTENGVEKALWRLGGAGGGGSATGKVKVYLKDIVNDAENLSPSFGGIVVTLTNTTDKDSTPVTKTLAAGETMVTFSKVTPLKNYQVSVSQLANHTQPAAQTIQQLGISEEKELTFRYEADEYTVNVESNQGAQDDSVAGAKVTYGETDYTDGQTFKVAKGTAVELTADNMSNVTGYAKSLSLSGKTINALYSTTLVKLSVVSNQSDFTERLECSINNTQRIVTATGTTAKESNTVKVPTGTTLTIVAPDVTGYSKTIGAYTVATGAEQTISVAYEAEKLTVSVSADQGSPDLSGVAIVVRDTTDSKAITPVNGVYMIPGGHGYSIVASTAVDGYTTPSAITGTASGASASVELEYAYNPIMYAYVKIDQTQSGDTAMITVSDTEGGSALTCPTTPTQKHPNAAIQAIKDASHLFMGKFADGKMTLRQLKDDDGTKYLDGTSANMDGTDGDHFLRIGVDFYIKRVAGADSGNQVTYGIAVGGQPDETWKQIVTPNDLLGVHEAYISGNMLYSRSGIQSGASQTRDTFKQYARNRGTGFSCVTWEWHCMMAFLFYAWYGRTNAQAQCGTGSDSYTRTLGTKDSLGMTDTDSGNGNADNTKFWGLENWWGCKYEWVDNVDVTDRNWTVKDISGNTKRSGLQANTADGWINKLMLSENLDMIPTGVGGGDTTYYCDYYWQSSGSRVVARSCRNAYAYGGVAFVDADIGVAYAYASIGSRLAFSGQIEIS